VGVRVCEACLRTPAFEMNNLAKNKARAWRRRSGSEFVMTWIIYQH
jgi:hypothetical protein